MWDEMPLLLQPHAFPLPSTTRHSMERHFWQLLVPGSHPCAAFRERSTEPATTGVTAMARASMMLVVFDCSTIRKEQHKPKKTPNKQLFDFWCLGLQSHVNFGAHPSPTAAALPKHKQQKWPRIFAVNPLGSTSFIATSCHMRLESV